MPLPSHGRRGLLLALLCGAPSPSSSSASAVGAAPAKNATGRLVEAWLYGNVVKYAYYYAELLIGSPEPQRTSVIVDTGSHLIGFPCKGCTQCGDHIDPAFDFSQSESAEWLNCSRSCDDCVNGTCRYKVQYSEGSGVAGRWFEDVLRFEGPSGEGPPVRARLGCHLRESNLFLTQRADGIMGLAPSSSNPEIMVHETVLKDLFQDEDFVNSAVFSLCFSTWGGRLMLGGHDSSYRSRGDGAAADTGADAGSIQWLAMKPDVYYTVYPTGLMLDGLVVAAGPAPFGMTIVDSGTTYSSFPGPLYNNLLNDIQTYCGIHGCGKKESYECWRLPEMLAGPRNFPTLKMQFGADGEIEWPPHAYMHQHGGRPDVWCYSFDETRGLQSVLGISWMLHKDIIFDLEHQRLGVVRTICPEKGRPSAYVDKASVVNAGFQPAAEPVRPVTATTAASALLVFTAVLGATAGVALGIRHAVSGRRPRRQRLAGELSLDLSLSAEDGAEAEGAWSEGWDSG